MSDSWVGHLQRHEISVSSNEYIYDCHPCQFDWLKSQPISIDRLFAVFEECKSAFIADEAEERHTTRLDIEATDLPVHTGFEECRQDRYWTPSFSPLPRVNPIKYEDGTVNYM